MNWSGLIGLGLVLLYIFIGLIVLSAFWTKGDEFDGFCVLMILFWPIVILFMILVGLGVAAWKIGEKFRRWTR